MELCYGESMKMRATLLKLLMPDFMHRIIQRFQQISFRVESFIIEM